MIDINTVKQYFQFLSGGEEKEIFTCAFLDKLSESPIKGCGVFHGTLDEIVKACESLNAQGIWFTLHVTLNRTNLRGSKIRDIVSPRALCLDIDKGIDKERINEIVRDYGPHLVVESSPGKYHLYWKVGSELSLEDWSTYQLGLSGLFDGDPNLAQVQHNIRVPGLEREKNGERIMPRIVWFSGVADDLKGGEIESLFPNIRDEADKKRIETRKQRAEVNKAVRATQRGKELGIIEPHPEMGRNNFLFAYLKEWLRRSGEVVHENDCLHEAMRLNQAFAIPLGADEVGVIARKVYPKGCEARELRLEKIEKASMELSAKIAAKLDDVEGGFVSNGEPLVVEPQVALEAEHVNGKVKGFEYDYSQGELRIDRFTEAAIAERVYQRFGKSMVYLNGDLYAFDEQSKVWAIQEKTKPILARFINTCINDLILEPGFVTMKGCLNEGGGVSEKKLSAAISKYKSSYMLSATIGRVKNWVWTPEKEEFDKDPNKLFVGNGLIDLRTGDIREAGAEDRLLRKTPIKAVAGAQCPGWLKFLGEVFAENKDPEGMVNGMQEVFGYCLTGGVEQQKAFIHFGAGCNGKSKILDALDELMGDYVTRLAGSSIAKGKRGLDKELERIGAHIAGKRVVLVDDLESDTTWNEELLKTLTGEKSVARKLYNETIVIKNSAKFHVACNTKPKPEAQTDGLLRRLIFIPYTRQFVASGKKDKEIRAMITAEISGILNWALRGLQRILERQKNPEDVMEIQFPEEVQMELEMYKEEYFNLDAVIDSMYTPSDELKDWTSVATITAEITQNLETGANISRDSVGRLLNKKGFQSDRKKFKGKLVTVYCVKKIPQGSESDYSQNNVSKMLD